MDEKLYRLKETLCNELEKYSGMTNFDPKDIEMIKNLSSACKNLYKICMAKEEEGGSQRGSYRGGSYDGGGSNRGGSYRRGYSREDGGSYDGGSYHGGREWAIRELESAQSYASGEREKETIRKAMEVLRNM